jgi:exodeoxyribonuclease VII large subunit
MVKPAKSQWEFGELFPVETLRQVLTVTELTVKVKRLLEQQVGQVWVTGEITNLRAQGSGHVYFSLKDAGAQLNCVLFRGEAAANRDLLADGQKVVLQGDLTVYEPRGQYQLRVVAVELQGIGALQLAFEKLKRKLATEGLFAPERKRPLPRYPRRIGLVTSPTGAAIRDVLHVVQRRNPALEIILAPCRVQGDGAAAEITAALSLLNQWAAAKGSRTVAETGRLSPEIDLILITRGGGSLEDLWAFNEEIVARAIHESAIPVVSAVGHEIDFTISDFVADLRAATPSAAAEIITEGVFASRLFVEEAAGRLAFAARRRLEQEEERRHQLAQRLLRVHPRRRLNEQFQRLDDLQAVLWRNARLQWRERQNGWQVLHDRFLRVQPAQVLLRRRQSLAETQRRLREQTDFRLASCKNRVATAEARLRLLSPANVLDRGYSITLDAASDKVIRAATEVEAGQRLKTKLKAGEILSVAATPSNPPPLAPAEPQPGN